VVGEQETGPLDSRCYWLGVALQLLGQYLWLAGSSDPQFTDVNARLRALRLSLGTGIFTYTLELLRRRRFLHRTLAITSSGFCLSPGRSVSSGTCGGPAAGAGAQGG
jgi:hypothetical protein